MTTPPIHPLTAPPTDRREGSGFDGLFGDHRILAILRGYSPAQTVALATRAWDTGVDLVEIPLNTPDAVASLSATVAAGAERGKHVGAGTVLTPEQVRAAAGAGARYTVAPGFDPTVLAASLAAGLPHLPGVTSPTEVHHAYAAGCRWLKMFPANVLGPGWLRAIRGPFPDISFVATGGIDVTDAADYLAAGARVVALGTVLADPAQLPLLAELVTRARGG